MKYEDRIVVFIDILGFSEIIKSNTEKNATIDIEKLINVFNNISKAFNLHNEYWETTKTKQGTHFSDSIVISYKVEEIEEIIPAIIDIQHLIAELINLKIILRGAITKGKLLHTDKMLFGPALIEAYEMETKKAKYPRIIFETKLINEILSLSSNKVASNLNFRMKDLVSKDQDGFYYIDYFFNDGFLRVIKTYSDSIKQKSKFYNNYKEYLKLLKSLILVGLNHKNPCVSSKYQWMREKYNSAIERISKNEISQKIKKNVDQEQFELIKKLKKIND